MHIALIAALLCAAADPSVPAPEASAAIEATLPAPASSSRPEKSARRKKGKPPMTGVLNINRASVAELRLLPGIGKKRAELIVERRDKKPFTSLDEVARMKGMRNVVHKLRAQPALQGDTTLRPLRP
jgi:DNA uptake protein ComE-like DNA-binding protein